MKEKKKHDKKEVSAHKHKESPEKPKKLSKFWTYLIIAVIIGFLYFFLKEPIVNLLKTVPWLWSFITHVTGEIGNKTYLGLFYLSFFGGMFFIILPVEGTFLLYLGSGKEFYFVIPIIVIAYTAGLVFDYFIGFIFGKWMAKKIFKEKFEEKKEKMKKTGGIVLFFSNVFPIPVPWVSVAYGAMKYKFKNFVIICLIGQALKFNLLYMGIEFLKPYYSQLWEVMKGMFSNFYEVLKGIFKI